MISMAALVAAALAALPAHAGGISGTVKLTGKAPAPKTIKMPAAHPVCMAAHPSGQKGEMYVVGASGALQNVIVYVKGDVAGGTARTEPVTLTQHGCQYRPHVVALQLGQPLKIVNDDETMHNVNSRPKLNKKFNVSQPKKGMVKDVTFEKAEIVPLKCDVHAWMNGYVGVFAHPYFAVTGGDGSFKIEGLPAGNYEVEAWHEKAAPVVQKVTVPASGDAKVSFSMAVKK